MASDIENYTVDSETVVSVQLTNSDGTTSTLNNIKAKDLAKMMKNVGRVSIVLPNISLFTDSVIDQNGIFTLKSNGPIPNNNELCMDTNNFIGVIKKEKDKSNNIIYKFISKSKEIHNALKDYDKYGSLLNKSRSIVENSISKVLVHSTDSTDPNNVKNKVYGLPTFLIASGVPVTHFNIRKHNSTLTKYEFISSSNYNLLGNLSDVNDSPTELTTVNIQNKNGLTQSTYKTIGEVFVKDGLSDNDLVYVEFLHIEKDSSNNYVSTKKEIISSYCYRIVKEDETKLVFEENITGSKILVENGILNNVVNTLEIPSSSGNMYKVININDDQSLAEVINSLNISLFGTSDGYKNDISHKIEYEIQNETTSVSGVTDTNINWFLDTMKKIVFKYNYGTQISPKYIISDNYYLRKTNVSTTIVENVWFIPYFNENGSPKNKEFVILNKVTEGNVTRTETVLEINPKKTTDSNFNPKEIINSDYQLNGKTQIGNQLVVSYSTKLKYGATDSSFSPDIFNEYLILSKKDSSDVASVKYYPKLFRYGENGNNYNTNNTSSTDTIFIKDTDLNSNIFTSNKNIIVYAFLFTSGSNFYMRLGYNFNKDLLKIQSNTTVYDTISDVGLKEIELSSGNYIIKQTEYFNNVDGSSTNAQLLNFTGGTFLRNVYDISTSSIKSTYGSTGFESTTDYLLNKVNVSNLNSFKTKNLILEVYGKDSSINNFAAQKIAYIPVHIINDKSEFNFIYS